MQLPSSPVVGRLDGLPEKDATTWPSPKTKRVIC